MRRVKRLNRKSVPDGQGELFPDYRHHSVFTHSPLATLQARRLARPRDRRAGYRRPGFRRLAHLPSGSLPPVAAWLVLAAIAFNLTRAAGTIASVFHAKAITATIRRQLIAVPGRLASSGPRLVIHLSKDWPPAGRLGRALQRGLRTAKPSEHLNTQPQ